MIIGFLMEKFNIRGSGVALYDYAHYNETILNNKSIIFSPNNSGDDIAFKKFYTRFPVILYRNDLKQSLINNKIDLLYVISLW